jgi:hypothetical protein
VIPVICNNFIVLIFLAGMYYTLSVNVRLCHIPYVYLSFSVMCWCCSLFSYSGFVCVVTVNALCCWFHFFKERGEGVLLSGVEFI